MFEETGTGGTSRPPLARSPALFNEAAACDADLSDRHLGQLLSSTGPTAENLRRLRASQLLSSQAGSQCLGVVAPVVGDGASSIALGLAAVSARDAKNRVLIVEGSLREPTLEELLGVQRLPGLVEWLEGGGQGSVTVRAVNPWGFYILPAGRPADEVAGLLSSAPMKRLLRRAKESYDLVIVDCPSLDTTADTVIIQDLLDGLVLVVRERHASQKMIRKSISDLRPHLVRGVVLNARTETFLTRWIHRRRSGA